MTHIGKLVVQKKVIFILLVSGALSLVRFNDIPVGSFFDDAHYIVLAESLAEGEGYRLINFPHAPVEEAFPPGWPLILGGVTAVFGSSLFWPKVVSLLFWLAAIPLVYKLFASRLTPVLMTLVLALVALNPHLIGMAGTAMSEASYVFFTLLALVLLNTWADQPEQRSVWLLLAIALAAFLAMLIRTIGVALVLAVLITLVRNVRRQHLRWLVLAGSLAAVGIVLLALFNRQSGGMLIFSQSYSSHLAYLLPRWASFLRFWEVGTAVSLETLANAVVPIFELQGLTQLLTPGLMQIMAIAVLLLVAAGFFIRCRQMSAVEWYVLSYTAIFYVWTIYIQTVQPRIALPLIPFATFYLVSAVTHAMQWLSRRTTQKDAGRLVQTMLILLMVVYLGRNVYASRNPVERDIVDLKAGTTWIADNLPEEIVVMSPNPVPDYLYMRRQTVDFPNDAAQLAAHIDAQSVEYILVRPNLALGRQRNLDAKSIQLLQVFQANPEQYKLVYQNQSSQVWIFEVRKSL